MSLENPFANKVPPAETPGEEAFRAKEVIAREGVSDRAREGQGRAGGHAVRRRGSHEGDPDAKGGETDLTEELEKSLEEGEEE